MNSAMEGMENLPEEQRDALLQKIEELQVRDRFIPVAPGLAPRAALHFIFSKTDLVLCLLQFEDIQLCCGAVFCRLCQLLPQ